MKVRIEFDTSKTANEVKIYHDDQIVEGLVGLALFLNPGESPIYLLNHGRVVHVFPWNVDIIIDLVAEVLADPSIRFKPLRRQII